MTTYDWEDSRAESLPKCSRCGMDAKTPFQHWKHSEHISATNSNKNNEKRLFAIGSISQGNFGILIIIFIGLFIVPFATSHKLTSSKSTSIDSANGLKRIDLNEAVSIPRRLIRSSRLGRLRDLPKLRNSKRKVKRANKGRTRCSKGLRGSYCMNKGKCRWIADLKRATCSCMKDWRGDRCQDPVIKFSSKGNPNEHSDTSVIIAVSLGTSAMVFVILMVCICWRRCKLFQNQMDQEDLELEKKGILTENHSLSSISNRTSP